MLDEPRRRTLASRLEDRDRARFTGRGSELTFLDRCLSSDDPPASVVHISGPGGIGKSALLREIGRRARDLGIAVVVIDGRELGPAPAALELALKDAAECARPLVLIDSYEQMAAFDSFLRRELLPELPDQSVVVIAGRGAPDSGWFTGGWESLTARLDLSALGPADRLPVGNSGPPPIDWTNAAMASVWASVNFEVLRVSSGPCPVAGIRPVLTWK